MGLEYPHVETSMGLPWWSHVILVGLPSDFHGIVAFPQLSYGSSIVLPWGLSLYSHAGLEFSSAGPPGTKRLKCREYGVAPMRLSK